MTRGSSVGHLKRYRELAGLAWRYGRSDPAGSPEELSQELEAMGPTFVKIGQVLSGRSDLIPETYARALERLQDRVKPFPFSEVEGIVQAELGARISKAFGSFEPKPLAAASLGQVHAATLRDGTPVVVKVQRPGIRERIEEDFEVLGQVARFLDKRTAYGKRFRFAATLEEFHATILQELDYELEAKNLVAVGENLREFDLIRVPQPIGDYTTKSVLTMEHVRGHKIPALSPVARLEFCNDELIEQLFKAYLKQVLVDGLFHADPHPGNVFLTEDGGLALLDLGMVGHLDPRMQENLFQLLIAVSDRKGENAAEIVLKISEKMEGLDADEFRRRISKLIARRHDQSLEEMSIGASILDVGRSARDNGLFVPSELTLLGKTLLQLDGIGRMLDPNFDPNAAVRRNLAELMSKRMRGGMNQGSLFNSILELKDLFSHLPRQLGRAMDAVANGSLELRVKATDAVPVIDSMQKIANRIAAGLILAALIVGAALLMRVQTRFTIWGYPGLAMLCFLGAAGGGVWLLAEIFLHDRRARRKAR